MEKELHGKLLTIPEHVAIILDGEEAFYAEKLWTFTGSEDSRTDL